MKGRNQVRYAPDGSAGALGRRWRVVGFAFVVVLVGLFSTHSQTAHAQAEPLAEEIERVDERLRIQRIETIEDEPGHFILHLDFTIPIVEGEELQVDSIRGPDEMGRFTIRATGQRPDATPPFIPISKIPMEVGPLPTGRYVVGLFVRDKEGDAYEPFGTAHFSAEGEAEPLPLVVYNRGVSPMAATHLVAHNDMLRVYADGTVVVGDPYGRKWRGKDQPDYKPEIRAQLDPDQVEELRQYLFEEVEIDAFDRDAARGEAGARMRRAVADARTTRIRIKEGDELRTISLYNFEGGGRQEGPEAQRFRRAVEYLTKLRQRVIDEHEAQED